MNPKKKRYLLVQIIESKQNMMNEPFSYLMTMKKKNLKKNTTIKKNHTKTARPNDPRRAMHLLFHHGQ